MVQVRPFCFTCPVRLGEPKWNPDLMNYLIYRREVGAGGLVHWQGYVEFSRKRLATAVPKLMGVPGAHVEVRRGSAAQAIAYCRDPKEGADEPPKEFGTVECDQGNRSDLKRVFSRLRGGEPLVKVAADDPETFFRYHGAMARLASFVKPPYRAAIEVTYYWGPPGVGKSQRVFTDFKEQYEAGDVFVAMDNSHGWFDGYAGEAVVIFDDFKGLFPLGDMLRLLERNPCKMWVKGGSVPVLATKFVFTAERSPEDFYLGDAAWLRRVTNVIQM